VAKRNGIAEDSASIDAELHAGDDHDDHHDGDQIQAQVLVIDDSELNRKSIVRLLRSAGMQVISTDSAIGATRLVLRAGISVVVVDLNMPAMQGTSLLSVFRRNPRLSEIGVVMLSGVAAEELVAAACEAGADAAISKLEMSTTLVPAIKRLLRRAQRPNQASGRLSMPASILAAPAKKSGSAA
jgi:CheY-like chemotaxis protein